MLVGMPPKYHFIRKLVGWYLANPSSRRMTHTQLHASAFCDKSGHARQSEQNKPTCTSLVYIAVSLQHHPPVLVLACRLLPHRRLQHTIYFPHLCTSTHPHQAGPVDLPALKPCRTPLQIPGAVAPLYRLLKTGCVSGLLSSSRKGLPHVLMTFSFCCIWKL